MVTGNRMKIMYNFHHHHNPGTTVENPTHIQIVTFFQNGMANSGIISNAMYYVYKHKIMSNAKVNIGSQARGKSRTLHRHHLVPLLAKWEEHSFIPCKNLIEFCLI